MSAALAAIADDLPVNAKSLLKNPSPAQLRELVARMPNARRSEFGNFNVETKVLARSKASTFIVTDSPDQHTDQCMTRAQYAEVAAKQEAYIAQQDMLLIEGFIGPAEKGGTPARLIIEAANANIAAMQQQLYFPVPADMADSFEPTLTVIYTPNLPIPGFPNDRLIAVDLENNVTRVFHSDYFGESKKGGLRMWNNLVYQQGGLPMHAGCKAIPVGDKVRVGLIIGLSGTGKTTTTFTRQNGSFPIQDDFVALLPKGKVLPTENGCFAKTFGLDAESEPMIHHAVTQSASYMENVSQGAESEGGKVDFFDTSYTENGRATFPFDLIPEPGDMRNIPQADFVLILNRNETIIPAVARLTQEQAAAYFMLGETKGTSAGGAEEAGKALRVPGTNPFFPLLHGLQGTRFLELLQARPLPVYLMNTGWVGGAKGTEHSLKVKIRHSSAVVKAIAEDTIQWAQDEDFGYEVATHVPGMESDDDQKLLQPKAYYQATGRQDEYAQLVTQLKEGREAHLRKYPSLSEDIVAAVK